MTSIKTIITIPLLTGVLLASCSHPVEEKNTNTASSNTTTISGTTATPSLYTSTTSSASIVQVGSGSIDSQTGASIAKSPSIIAPVAKPLVKPLKTVVKPHTAAQTGKEYQRRISNGIVSIFVDGRWHYSNEKGYCQYMLHKLLTDPHMPGYIGNKKGIDTDGMCGDPLSE